MSDPRAESGAPPGPDPMPPTAPQPQVSEALRRNWILMLALGILLVLGGMAAIVLPVLASFAVTMVVGAALLVAGAFKFAHALRCGGWRCRGWSLASAAVYLIGGLLLLFNPVAGMISLTVLMIVLIGADAILRMVVAFRMRPEPGWGWMLAGGIAGALLAVAMTVLLPWIGLTALGILTGIALIFEGWSFASLALASRLGEGRRGQPATA